MDKADPISPWFVAAEEAGEFIGIRFGRVPPGTDDPEWIFLRHTDFDGVGGFAELLRRRGAVLPRLPQIRHPAPASRLALLRSAPMYMKPRRHVAWSALPTGPTLVNPGAEPPPAVAWHVFDEAATTQIRRVCRKMSITVNSFLLKNLTKAIRPYLQDQSAKVPWMVPINLRGKVSRGRETDNHTSYVAVKICSFETVYDIHRKIYEALARGDHWANWYAYGSGRFLTVGMKQFLLKKEYAMSQWNIGSFSNLGDWDPEKNITQSECEGGWLFAPPVLRCQLLGAGCVTFQNRMSLVIQAHPDLTTAASVPRTWIQGWTKEIEIDVASVLSETTTSPWQAA